MRAISIRNPGPDYVLELTEAETPRPKGREILIKVVAAGLNRADVLQARGKYPPPPGASPILGMEVAGIVTETGPAVQNFKAGDNVAALIPGGGYAEYALAEEGSTLLAPKGRSLTEAASLPEAYFTVWTNLFDTAGLKPGETVLIHGGSSGIGTAAIQLCKALGCTVIATAAGEKKGICCGQLGADCVVDYTKDDFVRTVKDFTGGQGADVILDMVGGDYIGRNFQAAAFKGRIVNIAFQKGAKAEVDFSLMLLKRLTLAATTLRGRTPAEKQTIRDAVQSEVWPLIETGRIKPVIDRVFPLAEAGAAHARMREGSHIGKIVLTV
ncbi:putative PIG3 family NAD(P)H quinone oxidoreductase [Rhizomicrobium palustre]|uniref:Putative PIG3 family NAD(P)H quinone oxidoreductase n=1 Tax=Rhizomicrobium palustre TaxID=189966 RepID=A0A846MX73_9PROT|nr:NAD(P)H-quinone oxidoreductase [Rhizomicrobium palustre]NIK87825.1 putative PIG3 family NAD(P)H quinone oxidoreductase [Rhizomicrobium palustre]